MPIHNTDHGDRPTIRPSALFDFANSKSLDPRIDFHRLGYATYWDGHSSTRAEENLLTYGLEMYNSSNWQSFRSTNAQATDPEGTSNAVNHLSDGTTGAGTGVYKSFNYSTYSTTYAISFYAKANGHQYVYFGTNNADTKRVAFNLSGSGSVIAASTGYSGQIYLIDNGWYWCAVSLDINAAAEDNFAILGLCQSNGNMSGSYSNGQGATFYGFQIQADRVWPTWFLPITDTLKYNHQPVLQRANNNEPRFEHDPITRESKGLLIERSTTNTCIHSEEFGSWTKSAMGVIPDVAIAPDGTQTADYLFASNGAGNHFAYMNTSASSGVATVFSCYVKSPTTGGQNYVIIHAHNKSPATFRFSDATFTSNGSANRTTVQDCGNGWYRISYQYTADAAAVYIGGAPSVSYSYTGNGFDGILIWGAQVEVGAHATFPTSYVKTTNLTASRYNEDAEIEMADFNFANTAEGTIFAEWQSESWASNTYGVVAHLMGNQNSSSMSINAWDVQGNEIKFLIYVYGNLTTNLTPKSYTEGVFHKTAAAFKNNDHAFSVDGETVYTDSSGESLADMTTLQIGGTGDTNRISGTIKKLALYPERLSNDTLRAITGD